jgi:hypothetical protein
MVSETRSEKVGPLEVVEGDQRHVTRDGKPRFAQRPHGADRHVMVSDHERRWRAGLAQQSRHGSTGRLSPGIAGRRQFGYELQSTPAQSKPVAAQPLSRGRKALETGHDRDSPVTQIGQMRNEQRRWLQVLGAHLVELGVGHVVDQNGGNGLLADVAKRQSGVS